MDWIEDNGTDVTAAFIGFTTPISELLQEVAKQGWTPGKVQWKNKFFEAEAQNPHGETLSGQGKNDSDAVANLLMKVMRREHMRAVSARRKLGMWQTSWEEQLPEIAQAYAKAPIYDPKAAGAWRELAQDSVRRAQTLQTQLTIEVVDDPDPYDTPQEMAEDIHKNRHFSVSRANSQHPVWSVDENVAFRIVHDVLGHAISGGDFGWHGENLACQSHFPLLSPNAQKALFTECIAQTGYAAYYRSFPPQKVAFLDDLIEPAQEKENAAGHIGIHPSQSLAPSQMPSVDPSKKPEEYGAFGEGYVAPHQEGLGLTRVLTKKASQDFQDPNLGWESGVEPLSNNAFLWHGDPLQAHTEGGTVDTAQKLHTGWSDHTHPDGSPDHETMQQAVVNALRTSLLAPRKDQKWAVIHAQHLRDIPAGVDDPKRFHDALDIRREAWNQARGFAPGAHKSYWQAQQHFDQYVAAMHPELDHAQSKELADHEFLNMWAEEEERLTSDPKSARLATPEIEAKVAKEIERRLLTMLKPENADTDIPHDRMVFASGEPGKYVPWTIKSVRGLAQVGDHANELTAAALRDVKEHGGTGHHFRAEALKHGISGLGSPEISHAWTLLQPATSQLATVDQHTMEALGHDYDRESKPRDHFKYERELAAGRDASGYGHVPLGAFEWGLRDHKRLGQGIHQDHSALRVLNPTPYDVIDWDARQAPAENPEWKKHPEWWKITEPFRQQVADDWDQNVGAHYPAHEYPLIKTAGSESDDEFCIACTIPYEVKNKIANWVAQLEWPEDFEMEDPDSYHITILYAPHGWNDRSHHSWVKQYPVDNVPVEASGLDIFGPDKDTIVLRLDSPELSRWANKMMDEGEERGLEVSRFDGGYKAHVTVGFGNALPKNHDIDLPFRTGPMFLYDPRVYQTAESFDVLSKIALMTHPWHIDEQGNIIEGQPGHTLMQHLRDHYGLSTADIWKLDPEVGKRT